MLVPRIKKLAADPCYFLVIAAIGSMPSAGNLNSVGSLACSDAGNMLQFYVHIPNDSPLETMSLIRTDKVHTSAQNRFIPSVDKMMRKSGNI